LSEKLNLSYFREANAQYSTSLTQSILEFLDGSIRAGPAVNGRTLEEELTAEAWLDGFHHPIAIPSTIVMAKDRLYGGPQLERLSQQLEAAVRSIEFSFFGCLTPNVEDIPISVAESVSYILEQHLLPLSLQFSLKTAQILKDLFQISTRVLDREYQGALPPSVLLSARLREIFSMLVESLRRRFEEQTVTSIWSADSLLWKFNTSFSGHGRDATGIGKEFLAVVVGELLDSLQLRAYNHFYLGLRDELRKTMQYELNGFSEAEVLTLWQPDTAKAKIESQRKHILARLESVLEEEKNLLRTVASFS
jgi:hypothetical protein